MDSRRATPSKRKNAEALLKKGKSVTEVHNETGVSRSSLYKWCEELGIEPTRNQSVKRPNARKFDRSAISHMLETHSVAEVCAKFGCSRSYAYACINGTLPPDSEGTARPLAREGLDHDVAGELGLNLSELAESLSQHQLCALATELLAAVLDETDTGDRDNARTVQAAIAAAERARDRFD